MRTVLLTLLVLALALPAPAAVYRCRDKKGVLNLTDDPENFPPGCRPEGKQGETNVRPDNAPPRQPADGNRRSTDTSPQQLPAGSSGAPPDLNRPTPPPSQGAPGGAAQGVAPDISLGPVLEGWLEEARGLKREYLESQTGPERPAGSPDPRREIERRIGLFHDRLAQSPLSPQEKTAVEQELPPPGR